MGLFSGIETVQGSRDANYIKPGEYYMRVDRVKIGENRSKQPFFAVEMTCIHVVAPGVDLQGNTVVPHAPGETPSHMLMFRFDSTLPNIKAFVANVMVCQEAEVTEAGLEAICAEDQPMAGMIAHVRAREIRTRADKPFTRVAYVGPVSANRLAEELDEEAIERFFGNGLLEDMIQAEAA